MRKKVIITTIVLWLCIVGFDLYRYVFRPIPKPLFGYEAEPAFQIYGFLFTRFWIYLTILLVVIGIEFYLLSSKK
jgi:hypothetical protein